MSLRQRMLVEELPKNKYNLTKTAIKVGYAPNYANTKLHSDVRKGKIREYLEKWFNEEQTKKEIRQALKRFKSEKDNSNYARLLELQSKILGLQIDKSEIMNKNPDKVIISYNNTKQIIPPVVSNDKQGNPSNTEPIENKEDTKI